MTPFEARREQALIQSTAAKLVMTRHRVEQLRDALVERDKHQAEIGAATVAIREQCDRAQMLVPEEVGH